MKLTKPKQFDYKSIYLESEEYIGWFNTWLFLLKVRLKYMAKDQGFVITNVHHHAILF